MPLATRIVSADADAGAVARLGRGVLRVPALALLVLLGDGSDIVVHFIMVLVGPICAFAVVKAVPGFLAMMLQGGNAGGGGSFAMAAGAAAVMGRAGGAEVAARSVPSPGATGATGNTGAAGTAGAGAATSLAGTASGASSKPDDVRGDP